MNLFVSFFARAATPVLIAGSICLLGCGAGPQAIDENYVKASTDRSLQMRSMFDEVKGVYPDLSSANKEKMIKLSGGKEEDAKRIWNGMLHPPVGKAPYPDGHL